jgi:ferritin
MLSKNIETALNKQVHIEAESSQIYLSMASWSETHGLEGISKFMYAQSDEERVHMLKVMKFINERGGHAQVTELKAQKRITKHFKKCLKNCINMKFLFPMP